MHRMQCGIASSRVGWEWDGWVEGEGGRCCIAIAARVEKTRNNQETIRPPARSTQVRVLIGSITWRTGGRAGVVPAHLSVGVASLLPLAQVGA